MPEFKFDVRSSGACGDGRFGFVKLSNSSRNELSDCSSHSAGGTDASLYLKIFIINL